MYCKEYCKFRIGYTLKLFFNIRKPKKRLWINYKNHGKNKFKFFKKYLFNFLKKIFFNLYKK